MFHPQRIREAVEAIERRTGLRLCESEESVCIKVYEHFRGLEAQDGKNVWYRRPKSLPDDKFQYEDWEVQWITNEMYMCACSFPYWFFRYFFLKDKENRIVRPSRLIAQLIFLEILSDLDGRQLPIKLMILKARQLGMSTIVEAIILWTALFRRGSHCVIASAEEEKSMSMSNMVWIGLENLPLWMKPKLTRDDRKVGPEFGEIDSDIFIQHGSQSKGISRGENPVAAHLSEVAYYPDAKETIEASLLNAMHENKRTFLVLESTARKKGDWWHTRWLREREGETDGTNEFVPLFLPWYVGKDKYPTEDWLRNHPIPENWNPLRETVRQSVDAKLYVRTTPLLAKFMGTDWEMSREQMWCWEFRYVTAKRSDESLKVFFAEFASDERSCFQSKRWSVFTTEVLSRVEEGMSEKFTDYAIVGHGIQEKFWLREFWSHSARRIEIPWLTPLGKQFDWRLIPLKTTPKEDELQFFLRMWEPVRSGYNYTIGIDIGGGVGQNATVCEVLRVPMNEHEPAVEVAQLWSPHIASPEVPPFANALGIYYGRHMAPVPEALLAPEVQVAVGDYTSFQLSELGYSNFFYMDRYDMKRSPGHRSQRRGFATNAWSRPMMMESLKHGLESGWVIINSQKTYDELENLEAEELESGKTKYEHAEGDTDDCYMSLGIAYFCSYDKSTMQERVQNKLKPRKKQELQESVVELDSTEAMLSRHFQKEEQDDFAEGNMASSEEFGSDCY